MKNTTNKKNLHKQPSQKTLWAYYMQAIEPKSDAINQAFPEYHPQWVQQSQQLTISSDNFTNLRNAIGLSRKQCAAYLRTSYRTVTRWEHGETKIPFADFELLRLILESVKFKLSHPTWDGWFVSDEGKLVSPDFGRTAFTPEQLNWSTHVDAQNLLLNNEVTRLKNELDEAVSANTSLRELFLSQGVVDELVTMKDKLTVLLAKVGTAHVITFPIVTTDQQQEKFA